MAAAPLNGKGRPATTNRTRRESTVVEDRDKSHDHVQEKEITDSLKEVVVVAPVEGTVDMASGEMFQQMNVPLPQETPKEPQTGKTQVESTEKVTDRKSRDFFVEEPPSRGYIQRWPLSRSEQLSPALPAKPPYVGISARLSNLREGRTIESSGESENRSTKRCRTEIETEEPTPLTTCISRHITTDTMESFRAIVPVVADPTNTVESDSEPEELVGPVEPVVRFDEKNREILDPEDLPRKGKGFVNAMIPGDETKAINTEKFTMSQLCGDIPIGEKNERYEDFEQARTKRKIERDFLRFQKNQAKKDGRPWTNLTLEQDSERAEKNLKKSKEFEESLKAPPTPQRPELQFEDGKMIVKQESLLVDRHKNFEEQNLTKAIQEVKDSSTIINSASFSRREKPERWDNAETAEFYKALSMWGTDFNLIAQLFPGRSRRQIKNKYKTEERKNPTKLHLAMLRKLPVDLEDYSAAANTRIVASVEAIDRELEEIRIKHEEMMRAEEVARKQAKEEDSRRAMAEETARFGGGNTPMKPDQEVGGKVGEEVIGYVGGNIKDE